MLWAEDFKKCHIYVDSWSVANSLTTQMPQWTKHNWELGSKQIWGKELWQDIWEICSQTNVSVFPADAHAPEIIEERKYNREPDHLAEINSASIVPDSELEGLALWAHQKARHLGEKAT